LSICMGGDGMGKMRTPKVTILTPTFNDAGFISQMIESVIMQDYQNWELLIYDDASTDNTEQVVAPFLEDKRISYYRGQRNLDQLNALYQLTPHVTGDFVTLLHSDDMLSDSSALSRTVRAFSEDVDGVYADLLVVDSKGIPRYRLRTPSKVNESTLWEAFLGLGSNVVNDVFFVRSSVFRSVVFRNYILWNTFYWMVLDSSQPRVLKLTKIAPWYKYRVFGENYLDTSNETRKAFVLSGQYRTLMELSYFYGLKGVRLFSALQKIPKVRALVRKMGGRFLLRNSQSLEGIYQCFEANAFLVEELLRRWKSTLTNPNILDFFAAPLYCMKNLRRNQEVLVVRNLDQTDPQYFGKDEKIFFDNLLAGVTISRLYGDLINRAPVLKAVYVAEEESVVKIRDILRFLCLPLPILMEDESPEVENHLLNGFRRRFSWT